MRRPIVTLLLLAAATATAPAADATALKAVESLYGGIYQETLPNGLRVYLKPIPGSPVVTTMTAYKVGACDEDKSDTGLSHYLEHLLFKGTDLLLPGQIDRLTMRAGGKNNAWTSEDCTVYHFDFAADQWTTAFKIEADRMRNTRIDEKHEFQQEKGAVAAELDRNEDQPFDLEQKAILPLLFGEKAPYGHPVIGVRDHVLGAKAETIRDYYDRWYHPNNASLIVCGGFEPATAMATIKELLGPIPAAKALPARKPFAPPSRTGPLRKEFESKFEVPRLIMGFPGVASGDPDSYVLDVIGNLLSGGRTSRLYQKLIEGEAIAGSESADNTAGRYPGWFGVQVELLQGKSRERAEELVLAELKRLTEEPVSAEELERVRRNLLTGTIFKQESVHDLCEAIAKAVTINDLDWLTGHLPKVLAVTPADIQRVARKRLDPASRVVVWSVPKPGQATLGGRGVGTHNPAKLQRATPAARSADPIGATRKVVLPNGLTLLLLENHRLPIVVAQALVRDVRLSEPAAQAGVAQLVGMMLDEGTPTRTGPAIATAIENAGGDLTFTSAGGGVKVLAGDRSLALTLLFDCLTNADFPAEPLERKRAQLVSAIVENEQQPATKAQNAFNAAVYGSHPLGRPSYGKAEVVEKLTRDQLQAFHRSRFAPGQTTVAVVGDFDTAAVIAEITRLTAAWTQPAPVATVVPKVTAPDAAREQIISIPNAAQLYFYLGHPGIRRNDPDYYKLLVMDYVLGTGPGFTDRLSSKLRDRQGLAYTVSATITPSATDQPGLFACYIGTFPDKFERVKAGFMEELVRIRAETPSVQEVDDAKKYLLGSVPFLFASNDTVAGQLLLIDRYNLGFDYLSKFRAAVAAVTPADVQAVAVKHLTPDKMILVAAGAVDARGKPLAPAAKIEK